MSDDNKKIFIFAGAIIASLFIDWLVAGVIFPTEIPSPWSIITTLRGHDETSSQKLSDSDTRRQLLESESLKKSLTFTLVSDQPLFVGNYADPSVIQLPDKTYAMYLNKFDRGTFALVSENAFSWGRKTEVLFPGIKTARAFGFTNGVMLYYPEQQPLGKAKNGSKIIASFSANGFGDWQKMGAAISPREGYSLEGPMVFRLSDGSYRMLFNEIKQSSIGGVLEGEIHGATSSDGVSWTRDNVGTIAFDQAVEGFGAASPAPPQVLRPFVINWTDPKTSLAGYLMLYNSHSKIFAAFSTNGFEWKKLGYTGIAGTDIDGIYTLDGELRVFYGDSSAIGVVNTAVLEIRYE